MEASAKSETGTGKLSRYIVRSHEGFSHVEVLEDPGGNWVEAGEAERLLGALEEIAEAACLQGHVRGMLCNELPGYSETLWCVTCKARVALAGVS